MNYPEAESDFEEIEEEELEEEPEIEERSRQERSPVVTVENVEVVSDTTELLR